MKVNKERRTKIVDVLSDVLSRLCERNDCLVMIDTPVTRFHALRAPQITIKFYLERIAKYSNCSEECFILALIYIDRLIQKNGTFLVNSLNVHRLLITSIMVGVKFFDDQYFNNAFYGKLGGISCKEINLLETEFLFLINFNVHVETDVYNTYNERLMSQVQPLESDKEQQEEQVEESMEMFDASGAPMLHFQHTKKPAVDALQPSVALALAEVSSVKKQSGPPVGPPVATRVRHYPTQRCTPPSSNFLKTTKRIQMETR